MTLQIFEQLAMLGVRLALDDFGTGYSSLSYLSRFPFHKIKIDRAFVINIDDPKSLAVIDAMTQHAQNLDAKLVVEGVETSEQLELLFRRGVTSIQGFYYSEARPLVEIAGMIDASFPARLRIAANRSAGCRRGRSAMEQTSETACRRICRRSGDGAPTPIGVALNWPCQLRMGQIITWSKIFA